MERVTHGAYGLFSAVSVKNSDFTRSRPDERTFVANRSAAAALRSRTNGPEAWRSDSSAPVRSSCASGYAASRASVSEMRLT